MKAKTAATVVSIFTICFSAIIIFGMRGEFVLLGYGNIIYFLFLASGIFTLVMTQKNNNKEVIGMIFQLVMYSILALGSLLLMVTIWFLPVGVILLAIIATPLIFNIIYFILLIFKPKEVSDPLTDKLTSIKKLFNQGLLTDEEYNKIAKTYLDDYYPPKEG